MADGSIQLHDTTSEVSGLEARVLCQTVVDPESGGTAHVPYVAPVSGGVGRVTAGGLAPGQSLKTYVAQIALTASPQTLSLWTVTTGKTLYISDIDITTNETTTGMDIQIQAAAINIWRRFVRDLYPATAIGIETQPQASSGQAVTLVVPANNGKLLNVSLFAFEQ